MKVYLAGPDVFRSNAEEFGESLKYICKKNKVQGLWPLDNEIKGKNKSKKKIATEIFLGNVAMIDKCDAVIANIEAFRGASVDPGTAFEIGYARALNKPVFAYDGAHIPISYKDRVFLMRDIDVLPRDSYPNVEDFGLTENLMIAIGVESISNTFEEALNKAIRSLK